MQSELFRKFLREELVRRCKKNPTYSLRAFSIFLKTDHSTLAKLLNGKRNFGKDLIQRYSERLGLKPGEIYRFVNSSPKSLLHDENQYQQIANDTFQIISDWYHDAILELMRTKNFKNDHQWISRALGLSLAETTLALERLERVGLIKRSSRGKWALAENVPTTSIQSGTTSSAHRSLQKQILAKASQALEEIPLELRNQTSTTMAVSTRLLPEAIEKITSFRRDLAQLLSRSEVCDEVYQLSISLFPLTRTKRMTK